MLVKEAGPLKFGCLSSLDGWIIKYFRSEIQSLEVSLGASELGCFLTKLGNIISLLNISLPLEDRSLNERELTILPANFAPTLWHVGNTSGLFWYAAIPS